MNTTFLSFSRFIVISIWVSLIQFLRYLFNYFDDYLYHIKNITTHSFVSCIFSNDNHDNSICHM